MTKQQNGWIPETIKETSNFTKLINYTRFSRQQTRQLHNAVFQLQSIRTGKTVHMKTSCSQLLNYAKKKDQKERQTAHIENAKFLN